MIKYLVYLFLILSLLSLPVFIIYWSGNETEIQFTSKQALSSFTLGNIGESEQICNSYFYTPNLLDLVTPGEEEDRTDPENLLDNLTPPNRRNLQDDDLEEEDEEDEDEEEEDEDDFDVNTLEDNHIELFCSYGFMTSLDIFGLEVENESSCGAFENEEVDNVVVD